MKVNKKKGTCVHDITDIFALTTDSGIHASMFVDMLGREVKKCKDKGMVYPRIVTKNGVFGNTVTIEGKYREVKENV